MNTQKKTAPLFSSVRAKRPALKVLAAGAGLLLGAFTAESRDVNLITNGGFESGNFSGWMTIPAADGSDFGVGGPTQISPVGLGAANFGSPLESDPFGVFPRSGLYAAYFGSIFGESDAISQRIRTFSGRLGKYRVSFSLRSAGPPPELFPSRFRALWNGRVIYDTENTPVGPYQNLSFKVSADGSRSTLTFEGEQFPGWYFLDDVSVELIGKFVDLPHLTPNQHAVAGALDSAQGDSRAYTLLRFIESQNQNDLPGQFDKIAPEELTSIFALGTSLATVQSLNIQRRTDDIRSGSSGFSAAGLAINGAGPSYSGRFGLTTGVAGPNGHEGKESKAMTPVVAPENRWGAFLSGTGEWVSVGDTDNARGYDLTSGGFTLGIDYKVTPNFAIGLAGGYTGTTADLTDRGRVWVNGGKIGLYATFFQNEQVTAAPTMSKDSSKDMSKEAPVSYNIAKGFYADVAAFGGYNSYNTRRGALQGEARGDTDGGELNVLFGMGYDFKKGNCTFGPTASFNYTYIGTNGFTEHGSLVPLDIHGGKGESLRTAFGLKASYDWKVGSVLIKPEIRAAWQHEFGDAAYALDSNFANGAGDSFLVNGPQLGRDSVLLGAGFAIQCTERCATYFYYDGELGRKDYQSTNVTGGVRIAF